MQRRPTATSAAAKRLGGQPENDQDARTAGFPDATTGPGAKKPAKPSLAPVSDPGARRPQSLALRRRNSPASNQ